MQKPGAYLDWHPQGGGTNWGYPWGDGRAAKHENRGGGAGQKVGEAEEEQRRNESSWGKKWSAVTDAMESSRASKTRDGTGCFPRLCQE